MIPIATTLPYISSAGAIVVFTDSSVCCHLLLFYYADWIMVFFDFHTVGIMMYERSWLPYCSWRDLFFAFVFLIWWFDWLLLRYVCYVILITILIWDFILPLFGLFVTVYRATLHYLPYSCSGYIPFCCCYTITTHWFVVVDCCSVCGVRSYCYSLLLFLRPFVVLVPATGITGYWFDRSALPWFGHAGIMHSFLLPLFTITMRWFLDDLFDCSHYRCWFGDALSWWELTWCFTGLGDSMTWRTVVIFVGILTLITRTVPDLFGAMARYCCSRCCYSAVVPILCGDCWWWVNSRSCCGCLHCYPYASLADILIADVLGCTGVDLALVRYLVFVLQWTYAVLRCHYDYTVGMRALLITFAGWCDLPVRRAVAWCRSVVITLIAGMCCCSLFVCCAFVLPHLIVDCSTFTFTTLILLRCCRFRPLRCSRCWLPVLIWFFIVHRYWFVVLVLLIPAVVVTFADYYYVRCWISDCCCYITFVRCCSSIPHLLLLVFCVLLLRCSVNAFILLRCCCYATLFVLIHWPAITFPWRCAVLLIRDFPWNFDFGTCGRYRWRVLPVAAGGRHWCDHRWLPLTFHGIGPTVRWVFWTAWPLGVLMIVLYSFVRWYSVFIHYRGDCCCCCLRCWRPLFIVIPFYLLHYSCNFRRRLHSLWRNTVTLF